MLDGTRIRVRRFAPALSANRRRAYEVLLDGALVGEVHHGRDGVFEVEPGRHVVEVRIGWARSRRLEIGVAAGAEAVVTCRSRRLLLYPYWLTLGRTNAIPWI